MADYPHGVVLFVGREQVHLWNVFGMVGGGDGERDYGREPLMDHYDLERCPAVEALVAAERPLGPVPLDARLAVGA